MSCWCQNMCTLCQSLATVKRWNVHTARKERLLFVLMKLKLVCSKMLKQAGDFPHGTYLLIIMELTRESYPWNLHHTSSHLSKATQETASLGYIITAVKAKLLPCSIIGSTNRNYEKTTKMQQVTEIGFFTCLLLRHSPVWPQNHLQTIRYNNVT